jgi:hypothetical protein
VTVVKNEIDFENVSNSLSSPYVKDVFIVENSSGKIDIADVDIFDYKKALILDGNTITIDVPEDMELEIIARATGNRDALLEFSDDNMLIIPSGEDISTSVDVTNGKFTITGEDVYIAALKLCEVVYINRTTTTESTTEATTKTTTETTTETTTTSAVEFDFSSLKNGTYKTDFTNGIFSLIASNNGYTIGGNDEKYITLKSDENSSENSEGYILIDAENMPNGFSLNIEALLQGYSYGKLVLTDENGETVAVTEVYDNTNKDKITFNTYTAGKYILKVSSGLPVNVYKLSIAERS